MPLARPSLVAFLLLPSAALAGGDAPRLYADGYDALQEDRLDEAERLERSLGAELGA